jgi:hypothetical protein
MIAADAAAIAMDAVRERMRLWPGSSLNLGPTPHQLMP